METIIDIQNCHYPTFLNWVKTGIDEYTRSPTTVSKRRQQSAFMSACYLEFYNSLDDNEKRDAFRLCVYQLEDNGLLITDETIMLTPYLSSHEKRKILFERFSRRASSCMTYHIHILDWMTPTDKYCFCRSFDKDTTEWKEYNPEKRVGKINDLFIREFGIETTNSLIYNYKDGYCSEEYEQPDSIS